MHEKLQDMFNFKVSQMGFKPDAVEINLKRYHKQALLMKYKLGTNRKFDSNFAIHFASMKNGTNISAIAHNKPWIIGEELLENEGISGLISSISSKLCELSRNLVSSFDKFDVTFDRILILEPGIDEQKFESKKGSEEYTLLYTASSPHEGGSISFPDLKSPDSLGEPDTLLIFPKNLKYSISRVQAGGVKVIFRFTLSKIESKEWFHDSFRPVLMTSPKVKSLKMVQEKKMYPFIRKVKDWLKENPNLAIPMKYLYHSDPINPDSLKVEDKFLYEVCDQYFSIDLSHVAISKSKDGTGAVEFYPVSAFDVEAFSKRKRRKRTPFSYMCPSPDCRMTLFIDTESQRVYKSSVLILSPL